jgi:ubiquinone/menaquinone biosynthesis C-methylase UbiE
MAPTAGTQRQRNRWERRYQRKQGQEFIWYIDEPPAELVQLIQEGGVPEGGALDIGCGPGVATAYLAKSFSPTVGLDIAHSAVTQARQRVKDQGASAAFVVAAAPVLPFRADSFSFLFDRGCLQALPREAWPVYMGEVRRLLKAGGVFQLLASKPTKQFPPLLSRRGLRARARWLLGRRGPQFLSHDLLRNLAGPSLETLRMENFNFQPTAGPLRAFTHAVFRKAA